MNTNNNPILTNKNVKLLSNDTPFAVRESFNQLRTNLMYTFPEDNSCPIFGITSVGEDAGKSTVLTNLAISFSQIGKKVLLIDGDMRCPTLYKFFQIDSNSSGLSEMISGLEHEAILPQVMPNLDLIPSGHIPPNPSELLVSNKLKELISQWKQTYDIIFFDFPPVGLITDALSLCKEITGYIFNIGSGHDNAKDINLTIESMEQVGAKIVGLILNDYNIKGSGSDYRRNRYVGYAKYGKRCKSISRYEMSHYERSYLKKSENIENTKK